jgi:hypothetical protein
MRRGCRPPVARLMFRQVGNRDPSCAHVSWTMKRLWWLFVMKRG